MKERKQHIRLHKSRFFPPYDENKKTNFPETMKESGVYLIKEDDKVVYIGHSEVNLYKTMYRHFQYWNHKGQDVVSYRSNLKHLKYTVRVVLTPPKKARVLEKALIKKHNPRDNQMKYEGYVNETLTKEKYQNLEDAIIKLYENAKIEPIKYFFDIDSFMEKSVDRF